MKKIMTIALLCATVVFATIGCSSESINGIVGSKKLSGKSVTQKRDAKGFNKIAIKGCPSVYYTQGQNYSVVIKTDEAIINDIKTYVDDGILVISYNIVGRTIFNGSTSDITKVFVTSPDLTAITLTGAGDFISDKKIDSDNMEIQLKGSGDIKIGDIICDNISTSLTGSGDVYVGNADALNASIRLTGSGDLGIGLANTRKTDIILKGSGDINVDFKNCGIVNSKTMGSGDIVLKGDVEHLDKDELGSGGHHISKLNIGRL